MSLESFNAENRNTMGSAIPTRGCSFCRRGGHNITTCSSYRLTEFGELCSQQYRTRFEPSFELWLSNYSLTNMQLVKAYSIRYCGATMRSDMVYCIDRIVQRHRFLNTEPPQEHHTSEASTPQTAEPNSPESPDPQPTERVQYGPEPPPQSEFAIQLTNEILRHHIRGLNPADLLTAILFMEMIGTIRNEYQVNRKFNIETKIIECQENEDCDCNICYENYQKKSFIKLNCGHEFCKECIKQTLQNVRTESPLCAFCRAEIKNFEITSEKIRDELNELLS